MEFKGQKINGPDRTAAFGIPGPQIGSQSFRASRFEPRRHVDVPDSFETASAETLKGLTADQIALVRHAEAERERFARYLRARNAEFDAKNKARVSESKPHEIEPSRRKSVAQKAISERRRRHRRGPSRSVRRPNRPGELTGGAAVLVDRCTDNSPVQPSDCRGRGPPHRERQPHRRRLSRKGARIAIGGCVSRCHGTSKSRVDRGVPYRFILYQGCVDPYRHIYAYAYMLKHICL